MRRTYQAKPDEVSRQWVVVDLDGKTVGRAATSIARILRGKNKPEFTPHVDTGDFVVAINAEKVHFTGRKMLLKQYRTHSGFPGNLRSFSAKEMLQRHPEVVLRQAVWGMLPKNSLGRKMIKKLKIYAGGQHPHAAQMPAPLEI